MLIRFARQRGLWELSSAAEILQAGFRDKAGDPDLRVSVYKIEPAHCVQAFAEHSAGAGLDPPRGGCGVDLGGLPPRSEQIAPGETGFAFTQDAHREIPLNDADELLALIESARAGLDQRAHEIPDEKLREYVASRFDANDPEWVEFAARGAKSAKWRRHRPRRPPPT